MSNNRNFLKNWNALATSLHLCGVDFEVNDVRDAVLEQLRLEMQENNSVITRLRDELAWMSKLPSLAWSGNDGTHLSDLRYEDIDASGALCLRSPDGSSIIRHNGKPFYLSAPK